MNTSPIKQVFIPIALVSSAVFSALTVPAALLKSEPFIVETPFFSGEIQPLFNNEHKDAAIRYVGFSVVVSIASGLLTAELIRSHSKGQAQKRISARQPLPVVSQQPGEVPSPEAVQLKDFDFDLPSAAQSRADTPLSQLVFAHREPLQGRTAVLSPPDFADDAEIDASENNEQTIPLMQDFQTCRIRLPHSRRCYLAVQVGDRFYSLYRSGKTRKAAIDIATRLQNHARQSIITHTEKANDYAVWVWEPEAVFDQAA